MCFCNCVNTKCILKNRKDSFITHRAFCDALSQENSRIGSFPMMPSTSNLNFRHNLMMMNNGGGGGGLRFPGMFGGGMLEPNLDANSLKPRIPIWLDQNGNESHLENPSNSSFLGSSSSNHNIGEMLPSEMVQWMNGNHETMAPTYSGLHLKEEEDNKGEMFNSMYNNYTISNSSAHMSATALLQKAAQMGSTRSTNNGDTNAFGLMTTSTLDSLNFNNCDNSDGLMMMMNSTNSTNTKQVKGNGLNESRDSDLTRDFLGVGRSFNLQQGLFKFTSSSMDNNSSSI